ncbi:MAG: hypothetical protein HYX20_00875 [Candidatus Yanofskybacteria bacterium]|nr:hypothetical protein [Candidatus Yanofskybacteria bacterium]
MGDDEIQRIREEIIKFFVDKSHEPFQPFAAYCKHLDSIWVLVKDCSVTEKRVNDILTILEDNYPEIEEEKCVGFVIEYACSFCLKHGLLPQQSVQLSAVLDAVAQYSPKDTAYMDNIIRPLLKKYSLDSVTIDFN